MANPDHLDKLCQGPKVWNEWRRENPHVVPDLSQATLGLNQRQFGPSNGGPIDLRAVNLEGAMLRFATLTEADLEGARLIGADLMHARLDRAKLIAADLTDAMLDHADLTNADLSRTIITGASFVNARNLTQLQIDDAFGDATTLLPASLVPPQCWFPALDDEDVYANYDPDEEEEDDLYEILGLDKNAKPEEIRTSYRNLVKKLHPDLNPDDQPAQELFKKVSTAYRILSDPEKRAAYDNGEIDSEGRVRPEYEAEQQFRRYAYRFYAAAVFSVFLAVGALVFAWNAVLRNNDDRAAVAVSAPKQYERLATNQAPEHVTRLEIDESKAEAIAEKAGLGRSESSGPSELEKSFVMPSAKEPEPVTKAEPVASAEPATKTEPAMKAEPAPEADTVPAVKPDKVDDKTAVAKADTPASTSAPVTAPSPVAPPAVAETVAETPVLEDKTVKSANTEPSAPPGQEANPQQQQQRVALHSEGSASPLVEDHKSEEAGANQSPPARTVTPEGETEAYSTHPNYAALGNSGPDGVAGKPGTGQGTETGEGPVATIIPPAGSDAVSSTLRDRAINKALAKDPQTTASIGNDEDARPEAGKNAHIQPAPRGVKMQRRRGYAVRRIPKRMVRVYEEGSDDPYMDGVDVRDTRRLRERAMRDRRSERRKQAVSEILMGGP